MRQMLLEVKKLPPRAKIAAWATHYLVAAEGIYVFDDEDTARRHESAQINQEGVLEIPG